jgi:hypothetical protein
MNVVDTAYTRIKERLSRAIEGMVPHLRMFLRFLALPYAYFWLVDWKECKASRFRVAWDFLYVFFVLRDFPDFYSKYRFWEKSRSEWAYYYGSTYNPFQRGRLRREVQRKEYEVLFEDKLIADYLCRASGLPVPTVYAYLEPNRDFRTEISRILEYASAGKVFIKEARGLGGRNIALAFKEGERILVRERERTVPLDQYQLTLPSIAQEFVTQHPVLEAVSPSVNTVRTESLLTRDGDVLVLGTFIRFGRAGGFVDNAKAGGLIAGVDLETGRVFDTARDSKSQRYASHPDSGIIFGDLTVPFWDEILGLTVEIQESFPFYKLLGPDIAVTPAGPVIVEINAIPDHVGLEIDGGPTLKDRRIWEEFKKYGLLINRPSRKLFLARGPSDTK